MASAQAVIEVARGELGNEDGAKYGVSGAAWCCYFVSWLFKQVGMSVPGLPQSWVPSAESAMRSAGMEVSDPKPGDIVFFDWDLNGPPNHIGIVESVDGSTVRTIEGNTATAQSDSIVARQSYTSRKYISSFMRPPYAGAVPEEVIALSMECIIQPDGKDLMVYYDGRTIHDLANPDCVHAINQVHQQTHGGASIPCFKLGTKEAPWAARFFQAVLANPPKREIAGGLYDFEPRSGWVKEVA